VYDLGMLLGYARARETRWLVLAGGAVPVGLAFEGFESHVHVERAELSSETRSRARPHVEGAVLLEDGPRPLIRIASLVEAILVRARSGDPVKEG
jgi:hypothetical protein